MKKKNKQKVKLNKKTTIIIIVYKKMKVTEEIKLIFRRGMQNKTWTKQ